MKLLFDENFERSVAEYFNSEGHDVIHVGIDEFGADDDVILKRAHRENRIIITNDLDFGYLVFHLSQKHSGIVLFRLPTRTVEEKIVVFKELLSRHGSELMNNFTVVNEQGIKIRKI